MGMHPADLICTERYPLLEPHQPGWRRLCAQAQAELAAQSVFVLPHFLRPEALHQMQREAQCLAPLAHHMDVVTSLYPEHQGQEPQHPVRRARFRTSVRAVGYPYIPLDSPLRALYEWDPLMEGIASLLGYPRIYRYDDAYGALNIAVMEAGDEFGWHFDQADFVVTLVLQEPTSGGVFECRTVRRTANAADDDILQEIITERCPETTAVPMQAGSFLLFRGRQALHRVTPIAGPVPRMVALLAYDTQPGVVSSPALLQVRYGIESPAALAQG